MAYVTFNYKPAGAKFVNPFKLRTGGTGTDTNPFRSIRDAITSLGAAGGTIVIAGGGLIQEDCTKLANLTLRTTANSGAIHFYFDSGFARSDMSQIEYFKICYGDSVTNFFWANGNFTAQNRATKSGAAGGGTFTNCIFDTLLMPLAINEALTANRCSFSKVSHHSTSYQNTINYNRCVISKPVAMTGVQSHIMSSCYIGKRNNGTGLIPSILSLGSCTCESGAVADTTNFVTVGDPMFVDVDNCNFGVLVGSPLENLGLPDSVRGTKTVCGLGGSIQKIRSDESIWSPANGAIYTGAVPDGNGGFAFAVGSYNGTIESADHIYDIFTVIGNIQTPIQTTYVDNLPETSSDVSRVCHGSKCSGTALVNTEMKLSIHASSIDEIYTGMEAEIISGAGTAGVYEVTAYNGTTKTATLNANSGVLTDSTTTYRLRDKYVIRYDLQIKFAQRGESLSSAQWANFEVNREPLYSTANGIIYGNADPGFDPNNARTLGGFQFRYKMAINALNYGV